MVCYLQQKKNRMVLKRRYGTNYLRFQKQNIRSVHETISILPTTIQTFLYANHAILVRYDQNESYKLKVMYV